MAKKKNNSSGGTSQLSSTNYQNFYPIYTSSGTGTGNSSITNTSNYGNLTFSTNPVNQSSLHVKGDVEIEGNLKVKGHDMAKLLTKIEDRLAILMEPDQEKLRQFPALKKAYDQYKVLDALVSSDKKGE